LRDAEKILVRAGLIARLIEPTFEGFEQNLGYQGALAGAGDPGYACKDAERKLYVNLL
jgi:hypothetical protein